MTFKRVLVLALGLSLALAGCTAKHYRKSADKQVAGIIAEKSPAVTNMDMKFTIEPSAPVSLDGLPQVTQPEEAFGPEATGEIGARILTLDQALDMAVTHSRAYQNRKEQLYLQALALTLDRHLYTPIFSGNVHGAYRRTSVEIEDGIDQVVEERDVSIGGNAGADMLLHTGGKIATAFSLDFLRFLTGDPRVATHSALAGTFVQPLLQGAGYKISIERLTQAERNLLYELRAFTRYRKEFSVEIASSYYGVLQARDQVRNNWRGFQNFKQNVAREKAFADEGLRPLASLDQLKQAELTTELRWINAVRSYRQNLDQFKVQLGLPADVRLALDDRELAQLKIVHPVINTEESVKIALVSRLDLDTQRDQLDDADRHVEVARSALLPQLAFVADVRVAATEGNRLPVPDFQNYTWNAGLDLDLPLDRTAERNAYRSSLIAQGRATRDLDLAVDNIKLQIADDWRNLDQAKRNYEISEVGVALAARRVEEQELRAELGRGTARDLIDAQDALIASRNDRTSALVGHTIARLRFWRDMGILMIKDNGQWQDVTDAKRN